MRVCNDDEIDGGHGFGPHPHSDMEVVTIVLGGRIKHEDNLGHSVVTAAGEIQRMTAGTGIVHAEHNASDTEVLRSLQLWFMPSERGLAPSFESRGYHPEQAVNALLPVVTPEGSDHAAKISQDLTIYISKLEKGHSLSYQQQEGRRIFLFVVKGEMIVNGVTMATKDTARIEKVSSLTVDAYEDTFFMLIDLP
jgi:redox-sensitive bicupin YhaK (pirin superfamily)